MTTHLMIDDLDAVRVPEQPVLSPDGAMVAYVLRTVDGDADRTERRLWLVPTDGGEPRRLTAGPADAAPAWSPDGRTIAFLRTSGGPPQVWLLPATGGDAEQLTDLPGGAGAPRWSPDGTRIAFSAGVDLAADPAGSGGDKTPAPIVADRLDYQADGAGLLGTVRSHLHVTEVDTGRTTRLTDGDWHAGDPQWSPDGTRLAFTAAVGPDPDLTQRSAAFLLDVSTPASRPQQVGPDDRAVATADWTADGSALLLIAAPSPSSHLRLLRLDLAGGEITELAPDLDRNLMPGGPGYPGALPQLVDGGATVLFCLRDRGCTHLYAVPTQGGTARPVTAGAGRNVSGLSVAGGRTVVVLATTTSFGELAMVDPSGGSDGTEQVLTDHGAPLADRRQFVRQERDFSISDGTVVSGWLVRDPDATGPQPLLLDIHGGPHNAWNGAADEAHLYHQELAAAGWTVLVLNPRGSDGYGEAFFTAAIGGWGTADAADVLEPVDALVADGTADPDRLAVTGYSYGGYLTCYLTSRDSRFAAAVPGGVVTDLTSMSGTSDAGHFLGTFELGGVPWQSTAAAEAVAAMSPLDRVDRVSTPTLILHGGSDLRCPVGQAQQWHTALRAAGVPSRLVLYPDSSHLFILSGKPSYRRDYGHRLVDWVQQYAGDPTGPRRPRLDAQHWQRRLSALAKRHDVPGASLGILRVGGDPAAGGDELVQATHGVLNTATGTAVTADSIFQIGSMTKVWTATVVMQLVEQGLLDLDAPLVEVLPELRLSDPDVAKKVTMRHLLTHTSGIDGDVFTDTGRGDDCLERYADGLAEVAQNHPLGATWSYCNSGFSLAGRVIEKLTGSTWDAALRERLFTPLGLQHTVTLPEEALLHSAAVGHVGSGDDQQPASVWMLPRALGPAGLVTASAADALAFARLHLTGGLAPDGTRLLRSATVADMAAQHADLPDKYTLGDSWGLGWIRMGWGSHRLIGHDGNTIGQAAFLRILPEQGLAVVLLTNGGRTRDLYEELYAEIFAAAADLTMPLPLAPPADPPAVDVSAHLGRYVRSGAELEVLDRDGSALLRTTVTGPLAELVPDPVSEYELVPVDTSGDLFAVREPSEQTWVPVTFYRLPTGERYLHFGVRATPKVEA